MCEFILENLLCVSYTPDTKLRNGFMEIKEQCLFSRSPWPSGSGDLHTIKYDIYWEKSILSAVKTYEEHWKVLEREESLGKAPES